MSGFGIAPDVELGSGGHISLAARGTTHDDAAADQISQIRFTLEGQSEIG